MTNRKPLSTMVAESLVLKIGSGMLGPGTQLPTEAELCKEYDVSRTVVREAVARLRSDGLIIPQQGRGMFVSEAPAPRTFSIPEEMLKTLPETIALLELRLSVEVEAAGLCAERRTDSEAVAIRVLMEQTDARHDDPAVIHIHYDYDFHLAIAMATRNDLMHAFLQYLRPLIVPRFQLGHVLGAELKEAYYARIHDEHDAIADAIERSDAPVARDVMRIHLVNSLERVRALASAAGLEPSGAVEPHAIAAIVAKLTQSRPGGRGAEPEMRRRPRTKPRPAKAAL